MRIYNVTSDNFNPRNFSAGDIVYITGKIYTLRDKACKFLSENFLNIKLNIVYNSGPIIKREKILSAGPTTTSRMEKCLESIINRYKIKAIIGKGGMDKDIVKRYGICYMIFTGGAGSLAAKYIKKILNTYLDELGEAEKIYELYVENFGPLIVAIDYTGNSILH